MKKSINSKLLNGVIVLGISLTILALIGTPIILTAMLKVSEIKLSITYMPWVLTTCIYICAIPYMIALFKLRAICKLLCGENPFSIQVSKHFKSIGTCAFSEVLIFIAVNLVLFFKFNFFLYGLTIVPVFVLSFIGITIGIVSLVMSNIFRKAAEIKEEIDLTF